MGAKPDNQTGDFARFCPIPGGNLGLFVGAALQEEWWRVTFLLKALCSLAPFRYAYYNSIRPIF
jgi:hypothetical protein